MISIREVLLAVAIAALAPAANAINKCVDPQTSKVTYSDAPCQGTSARRLVLPSANVVAPAATPARPEMSKTTQQEESAPPPTAPVVAQVSALDAMAQVCLDWYRPMLRDPAGAYYRNPSKEQRVLSITVHATNGFGGYVTRTAACEFKDGALDSSWTRIHAQRNGWPI